MPHQIAMQLSLVLSQFRKAWRALLRHLHACRGLITATLHLVNREFGELADDFVTLGLLPAGSDKDVIAPALTGVFSEAVAGGVSNISFGELSGNLGRTMYQYSFRIPPFYTLLVRSLTVLEVSVSSSLSVETWLSFVAFLAAHCVASRMLVMEQHARPL